MRTVRRGAACCVPSILLIVFALALPAFAGVEDSGTSSGGLTDQPGSARHLAMGGAGTAGAQGSQALDWNPAGLAGNPHVNAEFAYRRHWADTEVGFARLAWPLAWGVPAVRLIYAANPHIDAYDENGNHQGAFATSDSALKLGFAKAWGPWEAGLAFEVFRQDLSAGQVTGSSLDLGGRWQFLPEWRLAASLLRAGQSREGDPTQGEVRVGVSGPVLSDVTLALDLAGPRDADLYLAAGAEWKPYPFLALRAGWRNGPSFFSRVDTLAMFTAGLGCELAGFQFDYAYEPGQVLGAVHHVSLGYCYRPAPAAAPKLKTDTELDPKSESNGAGFKPAYQPAFAPAPRLEVTARDFEGRLTFVPKAATVRHQAREIRFVVRNEQGQIVKSFAYAGKAVPKELAWDGTDNEGRQVKQEKFTFAFEYITDKGVATEVLDWPTTLPAWKLRFGKNGAGVEASVPIRFEGSRESVSAWKIAIMERGKNKTVCELSGQTLAAVVVWDGRDAKGKWAAPDKLYRYRAALSAGDGSKTVIEQPILAIPAKMLTPKPGLVRFKVVEILFAFRSAEIAPEMGDRIAKAAEIHGRRGKAFVQVEGHADDVGSVAANDQISLQRAQQVREMMMRLGSPVAPEVIGFGKRKPLVGSGQEWERRINRRVEILFEIPEKQ